MVYIMVNSYTHLLSISCGCWEQVYNGNLGHSMHSCIIPFLKLTQSTLLYTHTWYYCSYIEKLAEKNETLTQKSNFVAKQPTCVRSDWSKHGRVLLTMNTCIWCIKIHSKTNLTYTYMTILARYFKDYDNLSILSEH